MRVVFMGSGELACPSLARLLTEPSVDVAAVVTQPDRPKGRRLKLAPCEVKMCAANAGIDLLAPLNVNTDGAAQLAALSPDLIVVVAYGQLLKQHILDLPRHGCVNLHASLLPRYRGAGPIQWSIAKGDSVTGVTTMFMDRGMDTGDIIMQREVPIAPDDTAASLQTKLAATGSDLLMETVHAIGRGQAPRRPQDDAAASYARKLLKQDGKIDWRWPARQIERRVRGFNPWPGCFCQGPARPGVDREHGCRIRLLSVKVENGNGPPGRVLDLGAEGPLIAAGEDAVRLVELQPEGGRAMRGAAYLCGHALAAGDDLDTATG